MSKLYRVLIDTCIWLDLAKNYRAAPLVHALYEMCDNAELEIIVPDIVVQEFERNKERALMDAQKALQSHVRLVKQAIPTYVDGGNQENALKALNDIDFTTTSGAVPNIVTQVEELLRHPENIAVEASVFHRARAANRALDHMAPCHRNKNSIADAILFEIYDEFQAENNRDHIVHVFATTNFKDFSEPAGDNRLPHSQLSPSFSENSLFIVDIAKFVDDVSPESMNIRDLEYEISPQFRNLSELLDAEHVLFRQIWYNRHQNLRYSIEAGDKKVVPESEYEQAPNRWDQILDTVWEKAIQAASQTEEELGKENLGPWDDFEWGMINGKLSALRWLLGDEWDMLDT